MNKPESRNAVVLLWVFLFLCIGCEAAGPRSFGKDIADSNIRIEYVLMFRDEKLNLEWIVWNTGPSSVYIDSNVDFSWDLRDGKSLIAGGSSQVVWGFGQQFVELLPADLSLMKLGQYVNGGAITGTTELGSGVEYGQFVEAEGEVLAEIRVLLGNGRGINHVALKTYVIPAYRMPVKKSEKKG